MVAVAVEVECGTSRLAEVDANWCGRLALEGGGEMTGVP